MAEPKPYPRSLYLGGDVNQERIVVDDEIDEVAMRHKGYLKAFEKPAEVAAPAPKMKAVPPEDVPAPAQSVRKAVLDILSPAKKTAKK